MIERGFTGEEVKAILDLEYPGKTKERVVRDHRKMYNARTRLVITPAYKNQKDFLSMVDKYMTENHTDDYYNVKGGETWTSAASDPIEDSEPGLLKVELMPDILPGQLRNQHISHPLDITLDNNAPYKEYMSEAVGWPKLTYPGMIMLVLSRLNENPEKMVNSGVHVYRTSRNHIGAVYFNDEKGRFAVSHGFPNDRSVSAGSLVRSDGKTITKFFGFSGPSSY